MALVSKYAFRGCTAEFDDNNGSPTLTFVGPCVECGGRIAVRTPADAALRFQAGSYAQDVFPELSPGEREFLISGICDACWDKIFGIDDSEGDVENV